jgi:hypothetical protein
MHDDRGEYEDEDDDDDDDDDDMDRRWYNKRSNSPTWQERESMDSLIGDLEDYLEADEKR